MLRHQRIGGKFDFFLWCLVAVATRYSFLCITTVVTHTHKKKELIVDYIPQRIADLGPRNFNEQGKDAGAFFCFGGLW